MYGTASKALGQHFKLGGPRDLTIVGIVGDARYRQLNQISGDIFISYRQSRIRLSYVIVRTRNNPEAIGSIVRHEISQIDASQADGKEMTLRELVNVALARDRLHSLMLLLFGVGGMLLAAVGVYGVISDLVVAQKKEFGIRIALGARPATILGHLLQSILSSVLLAEIVGVFAATLATTAIRTTLFQVNPIDVISICSGCIVLVVVALIACLPPALKAAYEDPMHVLRE
jgi:ABC-type antimicrobial peptide transport system permease subunit